MKKSLSTLALGTFGLGITEFMIMAVLPYVANDLSVSIPVAGHFVFMYAIGVCVGAPLMVLFLRDWPLKKILVLLVSIFIVASFGMSLARDYYVMMLMRFLAGLPHGAYFGVSSIVADRLSAKGKSTTAVAIMCSGMSVANLVGIPLGTFVCHLFSWRAIFVFSMFWGILTLICIVRFIPFISALSNTGIKGQFVFLRSVAPWLIIISTLLGNGGVFCYYSYVSPLLISHSGISDNVLPYMMILSGCGMVAGNLSGGFLSDKIGPGHTGRLFQFVMLICLLGIFFFSENVYLSALFLFFIVFCLFGVGSPQQLLLLRFSRGGELLGGAMVQLAFNLGNAIGACAGGVPLLLGLDYNFTAVPGIVMVLVGIMCYSLFCRKYERRE